MPNPIPSSTYRLQLAADFDLDRAAALAPYLAALGISHVYASPILAARRGSSHGYDVTDPTRINEELGGHAALDRLGAALDSSGLGLIVDIVPNHMAASPENPWWRDVLEHGRASPWAELFDISWDPPWSPVRGRVLLASLGRPYGEALARGELVIVLDREGGLAVEYFDTRLPLDPCSWTEVLGGEGELTEADLEPDERRALTDALAACRALPAADGPDGARRRGAAGAIRRELGRLIGSSAAMAAYVEDRLRALNAGRSTPGGLARLDRLLRAQAYRLAYWRTAREKLNYRRFFNINELVGVAAERLEVFQASHGLILDLVRSGRIQGLRVDHVDGLADPQAYLRRLREHLANKDAYLVVEKILQVGERLPADWPVDGTTGYEFGSLATRVLVDPDGLRRLVDEYHRLLGVRRGFEEVAYESKRQIASWLFPGELRRLEHLLAALAEQDLRASDVPLADLRRALVEVTACLPVYRTYSRTPPPREEDLRWLAVAVAEARRRAPNLPARALDFVARLLRLELPAGAGDDQRQAWSEFVSRWQQVTGPLAAKGVEDTALYLYNPLVALNEVGGEPGRGAAAPAELHAFNAERAARLPHSLNATSTHDTKRSEDVRARLAVLSEQADEWLKRLRQWTDWNRARKPEVDGAAVPDQNTELLLYQTLVGVWPLGPDERAGLPARIAEYMRKASREARAHTSWLRPDEEWETALMTFLDRIWSASGDFLPDLAAFVERIAPAGAINALTQQLLKLTSPGVPDLYRGTEMWDLSLVDPDNRRPVDFERRAAALAELERGWRDVARVAGDLAASWRDGRIKLHVTARALRLRLDQPELFGEGAYIRLEPRGVRADNLIAFARRHGERWAITLVPRLVATAVRPSPLAIDPAFWAGTTVPLSAGAPARWCDVLSGTTVEAPLRLTEVLRALPVALLVPDPGAGGEARNAHR